MCKVLEAAEERYARAVNKMVDANTGVICSGGCEKPIELTIETWFQNLKTELWYCPTCVREKPKKYPEWSKCLKLPEISVQ